MKTFRMEDVERIEEMLAAGKTVEIEWHIPYEKDNKVETVKSVRWDGLVFTAGNCVFTGLDKLVEIREKKEVQKNTQSATRIIWRVESEEQAKREHPNWSRKQINAFIDAIETTLETKGFFD